MIKNVSKQREKRHYTNNTWNNTTTKLTLTMLPTINRTIAASIWFVAGACTSTVIMFGSVVAMTMIFAWSEFPPVEWICVINDPYDPVLEIN